MERDPLTVEKPWRRFERSTPTVYRISIVQTRALILLAVAACVAAAHTPRKVGPEETYRPTPAPDRIILTWSGDPATTQSVTWRTDVTVTKGLAEIAEATDGPDFRKSAEQFTAVTEPLKTEMNEAHYHSVTFTQLRPDTMYVYRVGDGENWSEWHQFRTASAGPAPLEFIYVGDAQNDIFSMWSRVIREGFMNAPRTRFLVHAGDLVNTGTNDAHWGEWHRAAGWINGAVSAFPSPGNHEYGGSSKRGLTAHWRKQFTLPANGVPGLEESNYHLDIQGVRMISLNSNEKQKEQAEWLDKLLAENPSRWTLVTFHHPIFSTGKGRDNKSWREMLQPVFDKHGVDMVLTGHDHTYGRTNVVAGTNVQAGKAGTVYVVSVSGPKMYKVDPKPNMVRVAQDTQLFQVIRIDGDRLIYESRTARGVLYDSFELRKRKGRPNQMINRIPKTPEVPSLPSGGQ